MEICRFANVTNVGCEGHETTDNLVLFVQASTVAEACNTTTQQKSCTQTGRIGNAVR